MLNDDDDDNNNNNNNINSDQRPNLAGYIFNSVWFDDSDTHIHGEVISSDGKKRRHNE